MSKKLAIVSLFVLFAIVTHGYLTAHHYPLKFGTVSGTSLCNLNDTFDCDVAAASVYSEIAGIPLSVFGLIFHLVLFSLIVAAWTGLSDNREKTLRYTFYLSLSSVLASIGLAFITATQLTAWCPFCLAAYVWSLLIAAVLWKVVDKPFALFATDIKTLFSESKGVLIALALVPAGSWITHKSIVQKFGAGQLEVVINSSLADWLSAPKYEFNKSPALQTLKNDQNSSFEIVEFADFRCGHCGQAAPSLGAFKKAHPSVNFKFYNFPLDGGCNEAIERSGDGISCRLAKAVTCAAEQNPDYGWQLHDNIFASQIEFQKIRSVSETDERLKQEFEKIGISAEEVVTCMDSEETHEKIKAQAKMGADAKIRGTPTIFANGRRLPRGQLLPVLNGAFQKATD